MKKFSIVIVASRGLENASRKRVLGKALSSLAAQDYPREFFEVIVVDSGSGINPEFFGFYGARLGISLRFKGPNSLNIGPAQGRNLGVSASRFEYIAFTDDDSVVPADWLSQISHAFDRYPEAFAAGGLTLPEEEVSRSDIFAYFEKGVYFRYLKSGLFREYVSEERDEHPVFSGNIAYNKAAFVSAGGFDEAFRPYIAGEDGDLKERMLSRGGYAVFVPVIVRHHCTYNFRRFFFQQLSRGASILQYRKRRGLENSLVLIIFRLTASVFSFPILLVKERLDWRFSAAACLSLIIRNLGKIYYYGKI